MMFESYAQYYDLLYRDKDYRSESYYIDTILKKYKNTAKTLLDLGCGTGKHAKLLTEIKYEICGIDQSSDMLGKAKQNIGKNDKVEFICADISREFDLNKKFDVVTALFHVMSYQVTDKALKQFFSNVQMHLKEEGVFLFDCWYGPAVLFAKPEIRVKRLEDKKVKITRIAEPRLEENENKVEVHYDIFVEEKIARRITHFKEVHPMRYFFKNEIESWARKFNFKLLDGFEFMTGKVLGKDTWGSCFVMEKRK